MKRVFQIVDDVHYASTNCYQHQLMKALQQSCMLTTLSLRDVLSRGRQIHLQGCDKVISCLKLRTLDRVRHDLAKVLEGKPIVVYEQDPWESFKDDSPHKDAYFRIAETLNVSTFAVTVDHWARYAQSKGLPAQFVKIWILPEYCSESPRFIDRTTPVGFIGSVHPHRRSLFDFVEKSGIVVDVRNNSFDYHDFLSKLSDIRIFLHSADLTFQADGVATTLAHGLWAKDIEACARGCFTIREANPGSSSFINHERMKTAMFFEHRDQIPDIINGILKMDPEERQSMIDATVDYVRTHPGWEETVTTLLD